MLNQNVNRGDSVIYPFEYHAVPDDDRVVVYDIEQMRLLEINSDENKILKALKTAPVSIDDLHASLPDMPREQLEQLVNGMMELNMISHDPQSFGGFTPRQIEAAEKKELEKLLANDIMHIALNLTHRCNLDCDYCYGDGGSYGGPATDMTEETALQSVDFLLNNIGKNEKCRITFFGGEPLLNFPLLKKVLRYSRTEAEKRKKQIYFGITTNGTLLTDEIISFLLDERVDVTFSLDGPKAVHDANRKFKHDKQASTFDHIFPGIQRFIAEANKREKPFYAFRATITADGLRRYAEVNDFLESLSRDNVLMDYAEYKCNDSPGGRDISDDSLECFKSGLKKISSSIEENVAEYKDIKARIMLKAINGIVDKNKKIRGCISLGNKYLGIAVNGDIYPCHRFVGYPATRLGNIREGFDRKKWLEKYSKINVFSSPVCSSCWARYNCGGMCAANCIYWCDDYQLNDSYNVEMAHCKIKKIVLEEAMLLYTKLSEKQCDALAALAENNAEYDPHNADR